MTAGAFGARLEAAGRVAVDVGPFAAYLGGDERFRVLTLALFERIERGTVQAVTSVTTLMALLVEPYARKDEQAVQEVNYLLPTFPNLDIQPLTQPIADRAARYQARFGLAVDASIQAATAVEAGAGLLLTREPALRRVAGELAVVLLEDCL